MLFQSDFPVTSLKAYAKDYPHGTVEPEHTHKCAQLIHTLSGVVRVDTEAGTWVIPPERGVWVPAGIRHRLKMTGGVKLRTLFVDPWARADLPVGCRVVDVRDLLRALIVEAIDIPDNVPPAGREERIVELILDELRVLPVLALNLPSPRSPELLTVCERIHGQLHEAWSLPRVANLIGVSDRTVSRQFQRETGLTFAEWLRRKRLLEGLEALAAGHSVVDVALAVGYESQSAFSAMFRSRLGVSPKEYLGR